MAISLTESGPETNLIQLRQDFAAGLMVGFLALPICIAAGVLTASPLGTETVAEGAMAGLYGGLIAGIVAALMGNSSFIVTCPRASPALVLATLIGSLVAAPQIAANPGLALLAAAMCVFLAGIWQIVFAFLKVSTLIKFTPHAVFAGFMNGAAVVIINSQSARLIASPVHFNASEVVFVALIALVSIFYHRIAKAAKLPPLLAKVPGTMIAFVGGTLAYHLARHIIPWADLGQTLGEPGSNVTGLLFHSSAISSIATLWDVRWHLFFSSLVLATVATLESFMAFRAAQNAADLYPNPIRSLAAQGLANCFSSAFTFVASAATPSLSMVAYNSGARTRVVGISGALTILIFGVIFSSAVAELPRAVVSGILIALGVAMFDAWSVRSLRELLSKNSPFGVRRTAFNLAVVAAVMLTTVFGSVLVGVGIGCLLSMVIFVAEMSKPIIRQQFRGDQLFSKRIRSLEELSVLQQTGTQRIVLQLEGVLFFGNAEDLAFKVKHHLKSSDVVVLDLRKVTDIDLSGGNVLASLITKANQKDKSIIFCGVPPSLMAAVSGLFATDERRRDGIKPDLDTALEEIEERVIREIRPSILEIELGHIDLLAGISLNDLERLRSYLVYRRYGPGEALCRQGDAGDRMWLLVQGSVSVRIHADTPEGSRRITSLGPGTMVGEMALIEGAHRSATIVADLKVAAFELSANDFEKMLRHEPRIAEQFMRNCARELSKRLRRTSEDLRRSLE